MVIDEAMRLYPPAPLIPRMPLKDDRLGPLDVKAGTIVITSPYVSHPHRRFWDDPEAFRPERFAPGRGEAVDRHVYFPFGVGPRVCIGASFAMQEALTALAVLLPRFRFACVAPQDVFRRRRSRCAPDRAAHARGAALRELRVAKRRKCLILFKHLSMRLRRR